MIQATNSVDIEPIEFSCAAECVTPNWRMLPYHRAAIAARCRVAVRSVLVSMVAPQWNHYTITITRIGANRMDDDNLISACKPVRDEVAQWLGVDDGSERMQWVYAQRAERVIDDSPRPRRVYRTWVEVEVAPGAELEVPRGGDFAGARSGGGTDTPSNNANPHDVGKGARSRNPTNSSAAETPRITGPAPTPRPGLVRLPPNRLEREKTRPDVPADRGRTPLRTVPVGARGVTVELAEAPDGRRYVRVCKHFVQQGHAWRTSGVAVELDERAALVAALDMILK